MFKVGGVNSTQLQLLTAFVCGQQIDMDTDFFVMCHTTTNIMEAFHNNNQ